MARAGHSDPSYLPWSVHDAVTCRLTQDQGVILTSCDSDKEW